MKKQVVRILSFLFLLVSAVPLWCIELTVPEWEIVADGVSIGKPITTSWGFVTITDGRTLIGWTESGEKRFQQKLNRKPSELFCADNADFIWNVSYDRQYLSLFNPDGVLLWEKKLDAPCSAAPLVPGRDGRLFLGLDDAVICVDINGKTVWSHAITEGPVLSLYEKADGSLVCNQKMVLSPFGELLFEGDNAQSAPFSSHSGIIRTATCDFSISANIRNSAVTAYDFDGSELWSKSFAPEKVLYYEFTDTTIITLSESWVIAGWRYNSLPSDIPVRTTNQHALYESIYGISAEEKNYRSLLNGLKRIITVANSKTVNAGMRDVHHDMLNLRKAENSGYDLSPLIAEIIMKENDAGVLQTALYAAAGIGRDPDGLVYDAVKTRLDYPSFQYDDGLYAAFIDAVYSICVTSGSKERVSRAKEIITPLVTLHNRTLIQKHAATVLKKLVDMYPDEAGETL